MADESVVNPIAGEADNQVDILHGTNSVPCEWALGPIGQTWGNRRKSPRYCPGSNATSTLVGNQAKTLYPVWDKEFALRERLCAQDLLVRWVEKTASDSELRGDGGSRFRCGPPKTG
jgi:hypothetical protein